MRRLAALALASALLAGCGGGKGSAPPATTSPSHAGDRGKAVIDAFVAAARKGDAPALWSMLSTATKRRLGPTLATFRSHSATELTKAVGSFRRYRILVSERINGEFGVVAIDGSKLAEGRSKRGVYAAALRLEGSHWKVELGSPVRVRPLGPDPGAREQVVAQVAAAVEGRAGGGTAVMYLDGTTLYPKFVPGPTSSTLFQNLDPQLDPGRHTLVVFATVGRDASALGWSFTVLRPTKR